MKKTLFFVATVFLGFYLLYLLPAFSYSSKFFMNKYSVNEREDIIVKNVYDHTSTINMISMWTLIGIYVLFAAATFSKANKVNKEDREQ